MKRVSPNTPVKLFLMSAILLICSQASLATTVIIPSDDSLVIESRAIVRGKVLAIGTAYDEARRRVYTYITLRVQEVIKGQISERKIVIKEEGGQTSEFGTRIYGAPRFTPDQNVILYLDTWGDGSYRTRHMYLGKYNIVTDAATGQQTVMRETMEEGVVVLQNIGESLDEQKTERMELKSFLRMLRGKTSAFTEESRVFEEKYFAGVPTLPEPPEYDEVNRRGGIQPQWTYISSAHPSWFEVYDGQPVNFFVNTAGAPSSTIVNDIQSAMNAWSTISGSALRVVVGGTTSDCWTSSANNVINFNNCDGRWSGGGCQGVLALGGLSWFPSQTRVINGITFVRGTDGFVSFNPFAACNFGNSCNVQEITTHELGHALGLGHSAIQDATMFAIAHFDGRCASLRQDDMDAMRTIYPGGGGGGGPLSIVTNSPLASATTNVAYSQTLLAAGGSIPYTWSLVSGSLPTGLSLNTATGVLSGTPTAAGTANFTVQVRDSAQATAQKAYTLTVSNGGSQYSSQFISQTVPSSVIPGQQFTVNMKFLNNGTQPWVTGSAMSYYLASQNPQLNEIWGGNGVPLFSYTINPGETLDINFLAIAPQTPGVYNFQWQTYQNGGVGFFGEMSQNVAIQVGSAPPPATNNAEFVSQNIPSTMTAGQTYNVSLTMRNAGTTTWSPTSYKLGSQNPQDNNTWGLNRVALTSSTAPNSNATFTFNVTAPSTPGTYNFQWKMNDGSAFFGATSTNVAVQVNSAGGGGGGQTKLTGTAFGTSPAWGAGREFDKASDNNVSTFFDYVAANGGYTGIDLGAGNANRVVRVRYYARSDWSGGPGRMVGGKFQGSNSSSSSGFVDLGTITSTPPLGGWVEMTITDQAAYRYLRYLSPNGGYGNVAEIEFYSDGTTPPPPTGTNNAEFVSQTVPSTLTAGQTASITIVMRNSGTTTWAAGSYTLGSQNPQENMTWGLNRVNLPSAVAPGANATFTFDVTAPSNSGAYNCQWQMSAGGLYFGAMSTNVGVQVNGGLTKLTGAAFGTSPAWGTGREFDKATDNNVSTFFDYLLANGGYSGIDLGAGNANRVVKIRYYARSDWAGGPGRMLGGRFQGSNTSSSSGFVDLASITTTPLLGGWVEITISDPTTYRYLRYLSPDGGYGNVAEIEFIAP
jgi:hypothetical protein